ncbi:hypothetical protein SAMN04489860_0630 [Paraoerskovia marina]|uniref:Uncharacterized protein n=1 Tax=Paraoerskovia marina TaxID=545619 RepID=A0A1H1NVB0_9CELL|nr:hypothetical protein SAMN04489860_0630 [Paraoerskovia marina]
MLEGGSSCVPRSGEISVATWSRLRGMTIGDLEVRERPGVTASESEALGEGRMRNRALDEGNEISRRATAYFARALPPE